MQGKGKSVGRRGKDKGKMISIIYTMKKRGIDPVKRIKYALGELAKNRNKDP